MVILITIQISIIFSIAAVGPAIFIIAASYAGCDRVTVVAMFTLAMGFMGTFYPGMKVNPLDLSPNYAGILMAITNGIGACAGIIVPYVVGVMTPNVCQFFIFQSKTNIVTSLSNKVFARRMALGVLDLVRHLHGNHSRLLDLGIGRSSAVEQSRRVLCGQGQCTNGGSSQCDQHHRQTANPS